MSDTLTEDMQRTLADLRVMAMMLGMEVDIETLTLTEKTAPVDAVWVTRYKDKRAESDFDERMDIDRE